MRVRNSTEPCLPSAAPRRNRRVYFRVLALSGCVIVPAMEPACVLLPRDDLAAHLPADLTDGREQINVGSGPEVLAALRGGYESWKAYRDQVVRPPDNPPAPYTRQKKGTFNFLLDGFAVGGLVGSNASHRTCPRNALRNAPMISVYRLSPGAGFLPLPRRPSGTPVRDFSPGGAAVCLPPASGWLRGRVRLRSPRIR